MAMPDMSAQNVQAIVQQELQRLLSGPSSQASQTTTSASSQAQPSQGQGQSQGQSSQGGSAPSQQDVAMVLQTLAQALSQAMGTQASSGGQAGQTTQASQGSQTSQGVQASQGTQSSQGGSSTQGGFAQSAQGGQDQQSAELATLLRQHLAALQSKSSGTQSQAGQQGQSQSQQAGGQPQAQSQQGGGQVQSQQSGGQSGGTGSSLRKLAKRARSKAGTVMDVQSQAELIAQAQAEFSQELSQNLQRLRQVIAESQELARRMQAVLGGGGSNGSS